MISKIKQFLSQVVQFYEHFDEHPLSRLYLLRFVLNRTLSFVGLAFLDKYWKFNILIAIKLTITVLYMIFCVYTIWFFIDESVLVLQVFCCQGVFLPVKCYHYPCKSFYIF